MARLKKIFTALAFAMFFTACALWVLHPNLHSHAHDNAGHTHCVLCDHIKSTPKPLSLGGARSPSIVFERITVRASADITSASPLLSASPPRAPPPSIV